MPQNILALTKNQTPLESSSNILGLKKNINEQNQYLSNTNNSNSVNSTNLTNPNQRHTTFSTTNSNSKLNQGKLIYLNEKFSSKNENNYDELITTNNTVCKAKKANCKNQLEEICNSCCKEADNIVKVRKNQFHHSEINKQKRLSCEELEGLSERFADFIKIDSTMKSQAPLPPPPGSSAALSNNSANHLIERKLTSSPPLPPPPPNLIDNFETDVLSNKKPIEIPLRLTSRLSVLSAVESSTGESSLSSSSSSTSSTIGKELKSSISSNNINKPEPPQRTVSIRNSTCSSSLYSPTGINMSIHQNDESNISDGGYAKPIRINHLSQRNNQQQQEDCLSIKSSSIYSSCRGSIGPSFHSGSNNSTGAVRSSRSVFSIYEEEDESCTTSSASSTSSSSAGRLSTTSTSSSNNNILNNKLERLGEFEIKKIESMYRSIGSLVHVSSCTCDFFTTTSEQIASLLNDCWKLEINSIVPVWIFDTGFNPKRQKQLRLLFVDRHTAFPLTTKHILINKWNQLKNPSNDKRLTFTLRNNQLVCLIQFYDFFSCQEFFKFYTNLMSNSRNFDLFGSDMLMFENSIEKWNEIDSNNANINNSKINHSRSMMSLSKIPDLTNCSVTLQTKSNRYSQLIGSKSDLNKYDTINSKKISSKMRSSATTGNIRQLANQQYQTSKQSNILIQQTTITKNCISNPCAFMHINSLKDGDQRIKSIVENCDNTDKKFQ